MAWKEVLVKRRPRLVRHSVAASLLVFASLTSCGDGGSGLPYPTFSKVRNDLFQGSENRLIEPTLHFQGLENSPASSRCEFQTLENSGSFFPIFFKRQH